MATSQAQKDAIKRYREKRGGVKGLQKTISATVSPTEAERIKAALQSVGMTNAQALKRVADRIVQGDDMRRDYDRETGTLKPRLATVEDDGTTSGEE